MTEARDIGRLATALLAATLLLAPAAEAARSAEKRELRATIRVTEHGIPHVLADSWRELGFGYGFAFARENICTIADSYSQSENPRSPHFSDQTRLFARKRWIRDRFCLGQILADPKLKVIRLRGGAGAERRGF